MESLLNLQNICKSFYGVRVLKNVNFDLRKGEVHALLGENGAGKSTLIKILSGAYKLDSGTILLKGKEINPSYGPKAAEDLREIVRLMIGREMPIELRERTARQSDIVFALEDVTNQHFARPFNLGLRANEILCWSPEGNIRSGASVHQETAESRDFCS